MQGVRKVQGGEEPQRLLYNTFQQLMASGIGFG